MKIILLHGDDELKSYQRLTAFIKEAKARSWEVTFLDELKMSFPEIISSESLFALERFFVLKDIKKLGKKELDWLNRKSRNLGGNLIIYHQGYLPAAIIKALPQPLKTEEFKLPKIIFQFLESFFPKNAKETINLFHRVAKDEPQEFVFSLLAKHIRDLYWSKVEAQTLPYPSWRVGKLRNQAEAFSTHKLLELLSSLAEIDIEVKTSNAEIIPSLDLLIATKLE